MATMSGGHTCPRCQDEAIITADSDTGEILIDCPWCGYQSEETIKRDEPSEAT